MKKIIATLTLIAALGVTGAALADTYTIAASWTDPTPAYLPGETPSFDFKYRVAGGEEVPTNGLAMPGITIPGVQAEPGASIEITARTCVGELCSDWSAWIAGTAGYPPTVPSPPSDFVITITRTGP